MSPGSQKVTTGHQGTLDERSPPADALIAVIKGRSKNPCVREGDRGAVVRTSSPTATLLMKGRIQARHRGLGPVARCRHRHDAFGGPTGLLDMMGQHPADHVLLARRKVDLGRGQLRVTQQTGRRSTAGRDPGAGGRNEVLDSFWIMVAASGAGHEWASMRRDLFGGVPVPSKHSSNPHKTTEYVRAIRVTSQFTRDGVMTGGRGCA